MGKRRKVEVVDSRYQPSKEELEDIIILPGITPEEALRTILEPVEVVTVPEPRESRQCLKWVRTTRS